MVRKRSAKEFYGSAADFIRDTILGASKEGEEGRPGMRFTENGMHVVDVDVLAVEMLDERIKRLFEEAQRQVVVDAIEVEQSDAALAVFRKKEENVRATESEKAATEEHRAKITLKSEQLGRNVLDEESETEKKKREMEAAEVAGRLEREKAESDQRVALLRAEQDVRIEMLKEETAATVARFEKVAPGFTAALLALKDADVLVKVAQALSAQMLLGGKNAVDVFQQAVKGTPLEPVFAKIAASAGAALPGNGAAPTQRL